MNWLKQLLSPHTRLRLRVWWRLFQDIFSLQYSSFVKKDGSTANFPQQLMLSQPIKKNRSSANKKHNLELAIQHLHQKVIHPNQIFSYWQLIPPPTEENGFRLGRNLVNNTLALDYGGGLCQLSGIIYHLILEAGFEVLERHPHSLDIYTEATRYTPLGSDATVVFGHKDLRWRNNFDFPVSLEFELLDDAIKIHLCAPHPIKKCTVSFFIKKMKDKKSVEVIRHIDGIDELMSKDIYGSLK